MSGKPPDVDIVAPPALDYVSRVHVIVCHDLDARSHYALRDILLADRVSPEVLGALTRELAEDIMRDAG